MPIKTEKNKFYKTYLKGRFAFTINKKDKSLEIIIIRNNNQPFSNYLQEGYGLDDFTNDELEKLLKCWALEIISHRNFGIVNKVENISTKVDIINLPNNKFKITCDIESKDKLNLKII